MQVSNDVSTTILACITIPDQLLGHVRSCIRINIVDVSYVTSFEARQSLTANVRVPDSTTLVLNGQFATVIEHSHYIFDS